MHFTWLGSQCCSMQSFRDTLLIAEWWFSSFVLFSLNHKQDTTSLLMSIVQCDTALWHFDLVHLNFSLNKKSSVGNYVDGIFSQSPERWVWNWCVTAECAPGRTGTTLQGTKRQAQMSHTIGSAHLQQAVFNICDCIVNIYVFALSADIISPLVCTKSCRYLGQTDQDMVWGMTNYALLSSVIWRSIVLESSDFSLQHLHKYLQSLEKNPVNYLGCTVGLFGGEGAHS